MSDRDVPFKVVYVSGWGYSCRLEGILPAGVEMEGYGFDEWLSLSSSAIKKIFDTKSRILLIGWSLGVFLLHPYQEEEAVCACLWIGAARTFVRSECNPYGVGVRILRAMRSALIEDGMRTKMLRSFYEKASYPGDVFEENEAVFSGGSLEAGLNVLETACLVAPFTKKKVKVVHGREDQILSCRGGEAFARDFGYAFCLVANAGHRVIETHADLLRRWVQERMQ